MSHIPSRVEAPELEASLISALLTSRQAVSDILPVYRSSDSKNQGRWFVVPDNNWIARQVIDFVLHASSDGSPPSRSWLLHRLKQERAEGRPGQSEEEEQERYDRLTKACVDKFDMLIDNALHRSIPLHEASAWARELARLAGEREAICLLTEAAKEIEKGKTPTAVIAEIMTKGPGLLTGVEPVSHALSDFMGDLEQDIADLKDRRDFPERYRGWKLGIPALDTELGGLRKAEIGVVSAATGSGKTSLLRDFAIHAAYQGARVCIVSAEQGMALVRRQYLCCVTEVPYSDLKNGNLTDEEIEIQIREKMTEVAGRMSGNIAFLDMPDHCTVGHVRNLLNTYYRQRFDLYIWDHLGRMDPTGKNGGTDRYDWKSQGLIADQILEFARTQIGPDGTPGVTCWLACQDRPSTKKKKFETIEATDIGLSYLLAWGAHCVINVIRTSEMKSQKIARLKFSKVRDGRDDLSVTVETDLAHMRFLGRFIDESNEKSLKDESHI